MSALKKTVLILLVAALATVSFSGCKKEVTLKMATTTSTDNTGLLDYLKPSFEKDTGIKLEWVAVGTGKALALGKNCDVDVLLVHAPGAEEKYIADGHGIERKQVMYNDFIIIGPSSDPAGIKGKKAAEALKTIRQKKKSFASRGDNSGTNKKEIKLWKEAGLAVPDKESWYLQTGQGMINTITIAAERDAYTLTDRGTYIKYVSNQKNKKPLAVLVEGDASLVNQYSVMLVNPEKCTAVQKDLARKWSQWLVSEKGQKLIGEFRLLGKELFKPNAGK